MSSVVKPILIFILGLGAVICNAQTSTPTGNPGPVFNKYCVTCHNAKVKAGGFVLDPAELEHVGAHAEQWEKVVKKLRTQVMPPAGLPRPDDATYNSTAAWLCRKK